MWQDPAPRVPRCSCGAGRVGKADRGRCIARRLGPSLPTLQSATWMAVTSPAMTRRNNAMIRFKSLAVATLIATCCTAAQADPVRIGFAAESLDYAPAFAAERLGLFKKHGVEAKLIVFRGGAAAQEAMSAGAADIIAYFAPAVALANQKGVREKMVGTVSAGHVGWNLIVKADSPIKSLQDLAGKKIGISAKATTSDMAALF